MEKIIPEIQSAIRQFETVLLPKLPLVSTDPRDEQELNLRLAELRRIETEASQAPVFSIRFLGDTQNGKSTLINVLLGRKVLPEGHVGACSATIVRCRFKKQKDITIEFRYATREDFQRDLDEKCRDAEQALTEEESEAKRREVVCGLLGRFHRLLGIDVASVPNTVELIARCRTQAETFEEMKLLGTSEKLVVGADTEKAIQQNLSARGQRAFIVDECLIEGPFKEWHPAMELVDMPGTNAFNPWDDQVNTRLKQKVGGLAIVTKETQLHSTVMDWFKDSSILPDVVGASQRNQVRVFVLKTFVDQLNLNDESEQTQWDQTRAYCDEIGRHLRQQVIALVHQHYSAANEIEILKSFVEMLPIHYVSPKVFRALDDDGLRNRVLGDKVNHMALAAGFERFDQTPENTGIPGLRKDFHRQTENYIKSHFWNKLHLDFRKEVGLVARFFRGQRVGIEQRLAHEGASIHEVNQGLRDELLRCVGSHHEASEKKFLNLKRRFQEEIGALLDRVAADFARKTRKRLHDWMQIHGASLRCTGRKNGQHITSRGIEIDLNGNLADFCVEALNSSWISHRARLRKQLLDDLRLELIPELQKIVALAKGQTPERLELIESTYGDMVEQARNNIDLQLEEYDAEAEEFDALRPTLTIAIRNFLRPTYEEISAESGKGSWARMRNYLSEGVLSSIENIGRMVKDSVRQNWEGLTSAIETRISQFFDELITGFREQADRIERVAKHPSEGDEERVKRLLELEETVEGWIGKEAA
ncbi:MAG: dynamin family protein [Chthoniobacteraceae bacterium]